MNRIDPIPTGTCDVCDKPITLHEVYFTMATEPYYEYWSLCPTHSHLRNDWNHDKDRVYHGLKEKKEYVCRICEKALTPEEKETVSRRDFLITCDKHRYLSAYFHIKKAKEIASATDNSSTKK